MEDDDDPCSACGGPLVPLGVLGDLVHLRCRDCGLQSSQKVELDEDDPYAPYGPLSDEYWS